MHRFTTTKLRPAPLALAALACAALFAAPALHALPSVPKPPTANSAANSAANAGANAATKEAKQAAASMDIKVAGVIEKGYTVEVIHAIPKKNYADLRKLVQAVQSKASQFESADRAHRNAVKEAEKRKKDPPASEKLDKARTALDEALKKIAENIETEKYPIVAGEKVTETDTTKPRNIEGGDAPKDGYLYYTWTTRAEKVTKSSFGNRTDFTVTKGITLVRVASKVSFKGSGETTVKWIDEVGSDTGAAGGETAAKPAAKEKKTSKK